LRSESLDEEFSANEEEVSENWARRKNDAELRGFLSSNSSKEDEEARQKKEGWQELVE
jgi:hypothetical protein